MWEKERKKKIISQGYAHQKGVHRRLSIELESLDEIWKR